jgi:hypothetical protein
MNSMIDPFNSRSLNFEFSSMMKPLFLLLVFLVQASWLKAQSEGLVTQLSGQQVDNYVRISFTVSAGITCFGTRVERSEDGLLFETIGIISGVCGSTTVEEQYIFDDTMPSPNKLNYYRVNFGNFGFTNYISVHFTDFGNAIVVAPHPVADEATIYFPFSAGKEVEISLFNSAGARVGSMEGTGGKALFNRQNLPAGVYLLRIEYPDQRIYTSKILLN